MPKKTYYLSGGMSGYPNFNFDLFNHFAQWYRRQYNCTRCLVNPAESFGGEQHHDRKKYIRKDVMAILRCDGILLLPRWQESRGATLEFTLARELALEIYEIKVISSSEYSIIPYREKSVLEEADGLINGDRQRAYSHPLDDYTKTAKLWSVILGKEITVEQAILCMAMVKVSRELYSHRRDNLVDCIGYIGCLDMAINERKRRLNVSSAHNGSEHF